MKALSQILCVLSMARIGSSLECYNCDSQNNKECNKITKVGSIKPVECRPNQVGSHSHGMFRDITTIDYFETSPEVSVPMVCQKIVANNEKGETFTFRGCQFTGGKSEVCDITRAKAAGLKQNPITIEACEVCDQDNCNKSSHIKIKTGILFLALAILKAII